MIFTERKITIRNGKSTINEPVILYRGDYEVSIKFTIIESKYRFKSGVNLVDSEKASFGQLAILAPYGGNVFSETVECEDGAVTFTLTKEMIDQLEEVGLYSFQIRLFDYYRESRVSIPPVEFGIEIREPVASEDHNNEVNNAIVGYSIAKVVDPSKENVGDTFDANGNYNKTDWETGDRISEGKLNKIEDAIDKINRNEKNDVAALDKRITGNFNVLDTNKADKNEIFSMKNMGQDVKEAMTGGSVAVVGENTILTENIVDGQVTPEKVSFMNTPEHINLFNKLDPELIRNKMLNANGVESNQSGMYISGKIPVKPNTKYTMTKIQTNWGAFYDVVGNVIGGVSSSPSSDLRPGTITTPANTAYMRINGYVEDMDSYMVVEGEALPNLYTPYMSKIYLNDNITSNTIDKLQINYNIDEYSSKVTNLFRKDHPDIIFNTYINGSSRKESSGFSITHLIPVKVGSTYVAKRYRGSYGSNMSVELCDDEGKTIGFLLWEVAGDIEPIDDLYMKFVIPENVGFVRLNFVTADIDDFMIVEGDEYPDEYEPCYKYSVNDPIRNHFKKDSVNLFDKNNPSVIRGKWRSGPTVVQNAANAFITHPIKVVPGKTYKFRHEKGVYNTNFIVTLMSQSHANFTESIIDTVDDNGFAIFTVPSDTDHTVCYVTVNGWLTDIDNFIFAEVDLYPEDYISSDVKLKDVTIESLDKNIVKTNELEAKFNKLNKNFKQRINLFDKTNPDIQVAFLTSWTGSMNYSYTSYMVSHLIPIECGKTYSWPANSSNFGNNNKQIAFYDKDGNVFKEFNLVEDIVSTDENDINHVTIPYNPVVKYARVNLASTTGQHKDIFMFVESDTYPEEYIPYGYDIGHEFDKAIEDIASRVLPESEDQMSNKLEGKIVSFNGDSICAGAGFKGGYGLIIANRYNMVYENIGVGGGTITAEQYNSAGNARHCISRTVSNMREDADYIILEGGVNDASLNVPKGEITKGYTATLDDTTYCGAFESMLKQAIERFPGKKIGYIMVHKMCDNYNSETPDKHYYWSKQICEKWGVPYLDLNVECPPLNYISSLKGTYTHNGDGWHPNELGYEKYYVDKIIAFMERL